MRYGVVFPHGDLWTQSGQEGLRTFARAAEDAGYDYLSTADHVLGADVTTRPGWTGPYDATYPFREILVLFGFLAGVTTSIELVSAIMILAQRQTALVAKQAAEIDLLTGGRTRLGIGVGWNAVEFGGLGADFHQRGAYYEEQIAVLRLLWTEPVVTFEGRFHHIDRAGINPLPVQRPIPLWLGGLGRQSRNATPEQLARVVDRIGRLGDGYIAGPNVPTEEITASFTRIRAAAERAGRDPAAIGLQASLHVDRETDEATIAQGIDDRRSIGVTHLTMETRGTGLSLEENVELVSRIAEIAKRAN